MRIPIDEGTYLASVSTMYRLLREAGQVRERRAQAAHQARKKPELIVTGPNQVWSWDITKLAGPQRGVYYHLYVMIDIFSRCAVTSRPSSWPRMSSPGSATRTGCGRAAWRWRALPGAPVRPRPPRAGTALAQRPISELTDV
jgi:transposase InsO family protein